MRTAIAIGAELTPTSYVHNAVIQADGYGIGGAGWLRGTYFGQPVIDDGAPRDLQPYLQRASTYSFELRGVVYDRALPLARIEDPNADPSRNFQVMRASSVATRLEIDQYIARVFVAWASIGVRETAFHVSPPPEFPFAWTRRMVALPLALGIGLRLDTTRIDIGYSIEPVERDSSPFFVPFWSGASAKITTVIRRRVRVALGGELIIDGARGWASAAIYPTPNLGILLGFDYARGQVPSLERAVNNRLGGNAGVSYWFSSYVGALVGYAVARTDGNFPQVDHVITASISARH